MDADKLQYLSPSERELLVCPTACVAGSCTRCQDVAAALTSLAETRAVLAEHEWNPSSKQWADGKTHKVCYVCSSYKHQGHKSYCWLARLLHPAGAGEEKHDK